MLTPFSGNEMQNFCVPVLSKWSTSVLQFPCLCAVRTTKILWHTLIARALRAEVGMYKLFTYEVQVEHQGALAADDRWMQQSVRTIVKEQMRKNDETKVSRWSWAQTSMLSCSRFRFTVSMFFTVPLLCFHVSVLPLFRCPVITVPLLRAYRATETKH